MSFLTTGKKIQGFNQPIRWHSPFPLRHLTGFHGFHKLTLTKAPCCLSSSADVDVNMETTNQPTNKMLQQRSLNNSPRDADSACWIAIFCTSDFQSWWARCCDFISRIVDLWMSSVSWSLKGKRDVRWLMLTKKVDLSWLFSGQAVEWALEIESVVLRPVLLGLTS